MSPFISGSKSKLMGYYRFSAGITNRLSSSLTLPSANALHSDISSKFILGGRFVKHRFKGLFKWADRMLCGVGVVLMTLTNFCLILVTKRSVGPALNVKVSV